MRRTKSAVALTETGKRFLVEAVATLKQASQAELIGRSAARGDVGSVAVGYIFSVGSSGLLSSTMLEFRKHHPGVEIQPRRLVTFGQFRALVENSLDIGFTAAPQSFPSGLTGFIIDRKPFYVAVPVSHPFATRKHITPAMLVGEPFVAVSLEMEVGFGGGNIATVSMLGTTPHIVERVPDIFSVLTSVAAGTGITVVSEPLTNMKIPGIVYRKIVGTNRMAEVSLVYRRNESAPATKVFIDFMRARARALKA